MDMITVLNTIPATGPSIFGGVFFGLLALVLFIVMVFMAKNNEDGAAGGLSVVALLMGLFSYCSFANDTPVKYECTINEGVDFKAFTDTFKVDGQRGEIYIVHLRD